MKKRLEWFCFMFILVFTCWQIAAQVQHRGNDVVDIFSDHVQAALIAAGIMAIGSTWRVKNPSILHAVGAVIAAAGLLALRIYTL